MAQPDPRVITATRPAIIVRPTSSRHMVATPLRIVSSDTGPMTRIPAPISVMMVCAILARDDGHPDYCSAESVGGRFARLTAGLILIAPILHRGRDDGHATARTASAAAARERALEIPPACDEKNCTKPGYRAIFSGDRGESLCRPGKPRTSGRSLP